MTINPYQITGPAQIGVSGGRTSGHMPWKILKDHGGELPAGVGLKVQSPAINQVPIAPNHCPDNAQCKNRSFGNPKFIPKLYENRESVYIAKKTRSMQPPSHESSHCSGYERK